MKKFSKDYWKDFNNIKKILIPICKQLGRMPSYRELNSKGYQSMTRYGFAIHGGIKEISKKLNYMTYEVSVGRKNRNYWTLDIVLQELTKIVDENEFKHLPSKYDLNSMGRQDLVGAISKYGGIKKITQLMFENPDYLYLKKVINKKKSKDKYWTDEKIINDLKDIIKETGFFPTGNYLDSTNKSNLRGGIQRNGGQKKFWKLLNFPPHKTRPQTYFINDENNDKEYLKRKTLEIIKQIKHPPTSKNFQNLNLSHIYRAIKSKFGNIFDFYKELDIDLNYDSLYQTRDGHIVRSINEAIFDNLLTLYEIDHDVDGIIHQSFKKRYRYDFLIKQNNRQIFVEIWGYTKGGTIFKAYQKTKSEKIKLYKNKNLELIEISGDVFGKNLNSTIIKLNSILEDNNINFDKIKKNKINNYEYLVFDIYGEQKIINELDKIVNFYGYLPSATELKKNNQSKYIDFILKIGGFQFVRDKFDYESPPKIRKWTEKLFNSEIKNMISKYGRIPSLGELTKEKRLDLQAQIASRGGARKVAQLFNTSTTNFYAAKDYKSMEMVAEIIKKKYMKNRKVLPLNKIPNHFVIAINNFGGIVEFCIKFNFELLYPRYKNKKYLYFIVKKICKKFGYLPSKTFLVKNGYDSSIFQSIDNNFEGGHEVARELGYKYIKLRKN